uniref:Uncharacterized protein n=1 Tax=Anopheles atroparvus TaxID=41427 RepID=A0A182J947_ANOAO
MSGGAPKCKSRTTGHVTHVAHPASFSAGTGTSAEHVDGAGDGGAGGGGQPTRPLISATASITPSPFARSPLSPTWCLPAGRVTEARRNGDHWTTRPCRTAIVALHLHHYTLLTPSRSAGPSAGTATAATLKPATPPTLGEYSNSSFFLNSLCSVPLFAVSVP